MRKLIKFSPVLLALLVAGCSNTLTNLTPKYQLRNANGLYPVAVSLTTRQQSMRWQSIKPYVMVDDHAYLMRPMPYMSNRWETLVPVPPDASLVHYTYKVDFQYNAIPEPQNDSLLSGPQTLRIIDR
jgi:hypothetical protein